MSSFKNIFSSKLSVVAFVIFPIFLILLIVAWIYMLFFNNASVISPDQVSILTSEISSTAKIEIIQTPLSSLPKSNTTKASFDDLEKPKSAINSQSSTVILTSPIATTPELDVVEITTLLDKIQLLDNNDDASLDNQILEN